MPTGSCPLLSGGRGKRGKRLLLYQDHPKSFLGRGEEGIRDITLLLLPSNPLSKNPFLQAAPPPPTCKPSPHSFPLSPKALPSPHPPGSPSSHNLRTTPGAPPAPLPRFPSPRRPPLGSPLLPTPPAFPLLKLPPPLQPPDPPPPPSHSPLSSGVTGPGEAAGRPGPPSPISLRRRVRSAPPSRMWVSSSGWKVAAARSLRRSAFIIIVVVVVGSAQPLPRHRPYRPRLYRSTPSPAPPRNVTLPVTSRRGDVAPGHVTATSRGKRRRSGEGRAGLQLGRARMASCFKLGVKRCAK